MNLRRSLAALLLTSFALGVPASAAADTDGIELSPDGHTWQATLAAPLFHRTPKLVPGDDVTRTFYVRNTSDVPARATVEVLPPVRRTELADHLRVRTRIGRIQGAQDVGGATGCRTVVTGPTMLPGQGQRVDVALSLPDLPGQVAQRSSIDLALVVRLTEVGRSGAVDVCGVQADAEPYEPCAPGMVALTGSAALCADEVAGVEGEASTSGGVQPTLPASGAPPRAAELALVGVGAMLLGALLVLLRRRSSTRSSRMSTSPEPVASTDAGTPGGEGSAAAT